MPIELPSVLGVRSERFTLRRTRRSLDIGRQPLRNLHLFSGHLRVLEQAKPTIKPHCARRVRSKHSATSLKELLLTKPELCHRVCSKSPRLFPIGPDAFSHLDARPPLRSPAWAPARGG